MDLIQATGPGGIPFGINAASGATLTKNNGLHQDGGNKAATAHGIMYAIVTLAIAPFDGLVADAIGPKWAWMHGITATVYFAFVIGAMVPGVLVAREHVMVCLLLICPFHILHCCWSLGH
jgi:hypothetical protein